MECIGQGIPSVNHNFERSSSWSTMLLLLGSVQVSAFLEAFMIYQRSTSNPGDVDIEVMIQYIIR